MIIAYALHRMILVEVMSLMLTQQFGLLGGLSRDFVAASWGVEERAMQSLLKNQKT